MTDQWSQEPQSRHVGRKRNRVRIPKQQIDLSTMPIRNDFWPHEMTSSEKGRGLQVCQREGRHDLVQRPTWGGSLINCQRCGSLIAYKKVKGKG